MTKLQLRVGGVYLNRIYQRVAIVHDCGVNHTYRFVSSFGRYYSSEGRASTGNITEHDLVSEVIKEPPALLPADDLRKWAALTAMLGILASGKSSPWNGRIVADMAVDYADALIAALKEK